MTKEDSFRGYVPHTEFGVIVWYKTTARRKVGLPKKGKPITSGTAINRVVTNAADLMEAKKQLARYLQKPKEVDVNGPDQLSLL